MIARIDTKLVSIIVPTHQRLASLLSVSLPSIYNQTYPNIEVVVVADGPQNWRGVDLGDTVFPTRIFELGRNWAAYGAIPRSVGGYMAKGEYIGYLDDDDEFYPDHVSTLVKAIEQNNADFAFSQMDFYLDGVKTSVVGDGRIEYGKVGTPMILHKAECLRYAPWLASKEYNEDFKFYDRLVKEGYKGVFVRKPTIKYNKVK